MKKTLITCALPYANGAIHFGHLAGAYLPGDIYARYCRMRGDDLLFLCGSDEYGMAITLSAQLAGRDPQSHVDHFHTINRQLFEKMGFSWDHFSRTTWKGHQEPVQQFFLELLKNGYIEERWTDQLYSAQEGRFLADRYVTGTCPKCHFGSARGDECPRCAASYEATELLQPRSKITGSSLEKRSTKHWFLLLESFKESLLKWLETKPWKPNVMNFVRAYIEDLRPRAITRDSEWGIPVPLEGSEGKVLYVWFDAPIGYISAAMEWAQLQGDSERWKDYWLDSDTEYVQFLGKDNIPFHAVIFPAMIMGQDQPLKLVDKMPANEFYNLEGRKLSKSEGWSIDLEEFLNHYDPEALRYMIAATAPETSDSEFSWQEFQTRINSELVGKWGNFIHRTLTFVQKIGGEVPQESLRTEADQLLLQQLRAKLDEIALSYEGFKVRRASQLLMEMAQLCNGYFDAQKPWVLFKQGDLERLSTVIHQCIQAIQWLAIASYPIIPTKAQIAWQSCGKLERLNGTKWQGNGWNELIDLPVASGDRLAPPQLLFNKIEDQQVEAERLKLQMQLQAHLQKSAPVTLEDTMQPDSSLTTKEISASRDPQKEYPQKEYKEEPRVVQSCSIEQFLTLDIRCGLVLEADRVPKSKRLLRFLIDLGHEKRQILSGIAEHYEPSELVGKKILCLVNLPKVRLMGLESEGMILSLAGEEGVDLPQLSKATIGSRLR